MDGMPEITELPWAMTDGEEHVAKIVPVEVSLKGLASEEVQVLGHLGRAVEGITPIYARQNHYDFLKVYQALLALERSQRGRDQDPIAAYNTLLAMSNSFWEFGGKTFRLPFPRESLIQHPDLLSLEAVLDQGRAPLGRGLYPREMTEEDFSLLGDEAATVNSCVVRSGDGELYVVPHEARFRKELIPVRQSLANASNFCSELDDRQLKEYIKVKMEELKEGTAAQRRESDLAWLANESRIDFNMGTGVETYLDRFKGVRGVAQGSVYLIRDDFRELCDHIVTLLPEFEATAPWRHKKEVDYHNMPKLRFADVVTWAGSMDIFPLTVMAHSLPNEKEFRDTYGSVNVIFCNVQEALARGGFGKYIQNEFLPKTEMSQYGDLLASTHLKLTAAHEIGHTTGGVVIDQNPTEYFGAEYSRMEEGRAEVFSLWALPRLVRERIISEKEEMAGYYGMMVHIIRSMSQEPNDHHGGRNIMFHYFKEQGGIVEVEEEGRTKYAVNPQPLRTAVIQLLAEFGDIKATGDKERLEQLKAKYLSTDERAEFVRRLKDMPLGTGLIFPTMVFYNRKETFTGNLVYPQTFREQPRTIGHFV